MKTPLLSLSDESTSWPSLRWTEFSAWPRKEGTVVVVPLVGLADWGLGLPLDLEEILLCSVVKEASSRRGDVPLLVLPPVRFVVGPDLGCAFVVSPAVACALIEDVVLSIKSSGFTKVVLLNASPWNEELCDAVARDLRIDHGLQMFCIAMSGLGLDLHPTRSRSRSMARLLYGAITGVSPEMAPEAAESPEGAQPMSPDQILESAAAKLASLLREIAERPQLPNAGRLGSAKPP
jgi:creatinine amidohydrolase